MYIYDDFDRTLVAERVNEFRDQVARRLSGALTEEEFKPLRLMNGVYLQLHAYMLRVAIPYGTLSSEQLRTLAHIARTYDRNYGHFTTRQNLQFNWIKLSDLPDVMADLGAGRPARHADQRQLRAQRHDRSMGRRRRRRGRGPAHLGGNPPAAFDHASGVHVPAAQVQDRDHRGAARPRGGPGARHRSAPAQERRGRDRLRGDRRRRAWALAVRRQDHQAVPAQARPLELRRGDPARLQPVRTPRQHLQGAHQDPRQRPRHREVRRRGRCRMADDQGRRAGHRPGVHCRRCRALPLSGLREAGRRAGGACARAERQSALRGLVPEFRFGAQGRRLCDRHAVAEARRRAARRRHVGADGQDRRSGRSLQLRRNPRRPRAEPGAAACRAARPAGALGGSSTGSASPRPTSASSPTSSPVRGSTIAASPTRDRFRWRRS